MQISNEIIQVLEYLAEKIGITIDWTNNNVLPYVEQLCKKFIEWEYSTSLAWIIIMASLLVIAFLFAIFARGLDGFQWFVFCTTLVISIIVICVQIFDMVECRVFPEKTIYDYIQQYIKR